MNSNEQSQYTIDSIQLTCIIESHELENIPNGSKVLFIVDNKDSEEFDIRYEILDVKSDIEHSIRTFENKMANMCEKEKPVLLINNPTS